MRRTALALAGLAAALALVGSTAALAADGPARQPFGDRLAAKLGITPAQLRDAWRGVLLDRIDAAVASGRITPARAAQLKQRLQTATPRLGAPALAKRLHVAKARTLKAAADALGLTVAQLRTELRSGTSLAQVAQAKGVPTDTLLSAMLRPLDARLTRAVTAGRITEARKAELVAKAKDRLAKVIARVPAAKTTA